MSPAGLPPSGQHGTVCPLYLLQDPNEPHRLVTCSTEEGVPFSPVTLPLGESARWRRLRPAELDRHGRGDGRVTMPVLTSGSFTHAWHVVPM